MPQQQQEILKEEFATINTLPPSADVLQSLPHLASTVLESLRLLPPIGQLINRRAAKDLFLGNDQEIFIPEGTYLGYNCYATNRDPASWGSDADDFRPERWGMSMEAIQKEYRRRKARAEFISFHGARRACLGEKFALLQIKVTLFILIRKFRWQLDPEWADRMTPAGPLSPRGLRLIFHHRDS
jgi:unspecific monooxygenase